MIISKVVSRVSPVALRLRYELALRKNSKLTPAESMNTLKEFCFKEKPEFSQKNSVEPTIDLQVIVPVYNSEKYLNDCIDSLLNQKTKYTFEVVVINDGSTDGSAKILEKYKDNPLITVIHQENGGVSRARNRALKKIFGKYVMFVDSDDVLPIDSIQKLLEIAKMYDAEIVEGSHRIYKSTMGEGERFGHSDNVTVCASRDLFGYPWGKVIRSDKLANFCFPVGFVFEDTVMRTLLYPTCSVVYAIPDVIYLYRDNNSGITKTSGAMPNCVDTFWMMKYCLEERVSRGQKLGLADFEDYLFACYRNWGRTKSMPMRVQESIFVLTCDLLNTHFGAFFEAYDGKYNKLFKAIKRRSFDAFLVAVKNRDIM